MDRILEYLRSGNRMAKPHCCSDEIYCTMQQCWAYDPAHRPTFSEIVQKFDHLLTITSNTIYLNLDDLPPVENPFQCLECMPEEDPIEMDLLENVVSQEENDSASNE